LKIPEVVEQSFRSMIRETMFVRAPGARFAEDAATRAEFYLDYHAARTGILAHRKRASRALAAAIERFVGSRLCDRLRRLPAARVFAPDCPNYDLLVLGKNGKRYGVRFVVSSRLGLRSPRSAANAPTADAVDELLIYDLRSGAIQREIRKNTRLCA
jgi:hypothetical protein